MKRPLAYITAPWSKNPHENAANAASYCRQVYDAGYSPVCPVLFLPLFLKDEIPQEHKDGIDIARDLFAKALKERGIKVIDVEEVESFNLLDCPQLQSI